MCPHCILYTVTHVSISHYTESHTQRKLYTVTNMSVTHRQGDSCVHTVHFIQSLMCLCVYTVYFSLYLIQWLMCLHTVYSHSCVYDSSSGWWRDGGWRAHACHAGTDERRDAGGLGTWCGRWCVYQWVVSCIWMSGVVFVWMRHGMYMKQARHVYD